MNGNDIALKGYYKVGTHKCTMYVVDYSQGAGQIAAARLQYACGTGSAMVGGTCADWAGLDDPAIQLVAFAMEGLEECDLWYWKSME